jgi:uncharacterized protein (UPF0335 family)
MAKGSQQQDGRNEPDDLAFKAVQIGKIQRQQEKAASANGELRAVYKAVETKGIHLKAVKRAITAAKSDKISEIITEQTAFFEYLLILGVPLAKKQLDLFMYEDDRVDGIEKAGRLGRFSALLGDGEGSNPYASDSKQGQAWLKSHRDAVLEAREVNRMSAESGEQTIETKAKADEPKVDAPKAEKKGRKKADPAETKVQGETEDEMNVFGDLKSLGKPPAAAPDPDGNPPSDLAPPNPDEEFEAADPAKSGNVKAFPGTRVAH